MSQGRAALKRIIASDPGASYGTPHPWWGSRTPTTDGKPLLLVGHRGGGAQVHAVAGRFRAAHGDDLDVVHAAAAAGEPNVYPVPGREHVTAQHVFFPRAVVR